MKFIDLFCGIGGFHQALSNVGFECVFACDINAKCRSIYKENYNMEPKSDIRDIIIKDIPKFDILCAGFPCQAFSKAGKQNGFNDDRGNLFFNIYKIIKFHQPKYLIMENVRNLLSHDKGDTWKVIYKSIKKLGYYTYEKPLILNTLHLNIPQSRERVIIICSKNKLLEKPIIPKINKSDISNKIKDIINKKEKEINKKYKINGKLLDVYNIWNKFIKILVKNNVNAPKYPIWTDWWDSDGKNTSIYKINPKLSDDENQKIINQKQKNFYKKYKRWIENNRKFFLENKKILEVWLKKSRENENWKGAVRKLEWQAGDFIKNDCLDKTLWTCRGSGVRVKRLNYTPTLVAMSHIPIYGPELRKLTPREVLRLQSFPESFKIIGSDSDIYKQVGNAVNVKMIEKVCRFLIFNEPIFN